MIKGGRQVQVNLFVSGPCLSLGPQQAGAEEATLGWSGKRRIRKIVRFARREVF
jgi:hypothetical protein